MAFSYICAFSDFTLFICNLFGRLVRIYLRGVLYFLGKFFWAIYLKNAFSHGGCIFPPEQ